MKKTIITISMILSVFMLNAQEKVKEVVEEKYNRSSVSYIFVERNKNADVQKFYDTFTVSEKFDVNDIATKHINLNTNANIASNKENAGEVINSKNIGKEIISYIYGRKEDGSCNDSIILARGRYDAKDQDIKNMAAAKVKELSFEWGEPLVNSSYVVVYDIYHTETKKDDKGNVTHLAKVKAHAFKLDASKEVLDNFYAKAWADESSSAEEKANACKEFNNMKFNLVHQATVDGLGVSSDSKYKKGSIYNACLSAYENVVMELENKIEAWKVKVYVMSTRPIAAKVGKKEGIKNANRFQAYSFAEDKEGNLKSVKRGMVRATVVSNNVGNATGDTKPTLFYQISGIRNIEEGYLLRQKNDLKLGASIAIGLSTYGFRAGLDLDYIAHMGKRGAITYGMVNIGYNLGKEVMYDMMAGVGYGIPLTRFFEFTPYVMGGAFYDAAGKEVRAYAAEPGIRFAATIQPWSIYLSAGAQACFEQEIVVGPSLKFGIKYTF